VQSTTVHWSCVTVTLQAVDSKFSKTKIRWWTYSHYLISVYSFTIY